MHKISLAKEQKKEQVVDRYIALHMKWNERAVRNLFRMVYEWKKVARVDEKLYVQLAHM